MARVKLRQSRASVVRESLCCVWQSILDSSFWVFGLWIATPLCAARDDREASFSSRILGIAVLEARLCMFGNAVCSRQDLGDKNGALQGESRAHTLAYVTADSPPQSPFLAPKPTQSPKTESYALCFAALLIVIVRVDMPQITLSAQNLIRTH